VAHVLDDPTGLTLRARRFLAARGTRQDAPSADRHREHWRSYQVPEAGVELAASFQERWGGLVLPETTHYEGGPGYLTADMPQLVDGLGWCIEAGHTRESTPFGFYMDEAGRYGVQGTTRVPLHESVEGWVEACALEDAATGWDLIARRSGDVAELTTAWVPRVGPLTPVPEVRGIADTWLRGDGVMLWICSGEAQVMATAQLTGHAYGPREAVGALYAIS
jgi:hypothetical protein